MILYTQSTKFHKFHSFVSVLARHSHPNFSVSVVYYCTSIHAVHVLSWLCLCYTTDTTALYTEIRCLTDCMLCCVEVEFKLGGHGENHQNYSCWCLKGRLCDCPLPCTVHASPASLGNHIHYCGNHGSLNTPHNL